MQTTVNELVKALFIKKPMAKLNRYQDGKIYYRFEAKDVLYEIGIPVMLYERTLGEDLGEVEVYTKAGDVGTTAFGSEIRASELMRWIKPAAMTEGLTRLSE